MFAYDKIVYSQQIIILLARPHLIATHVKVELPTVFSFEESPTVEWTRLKLLGSGSFGIVHEVTDASGKLFALKVEPREAKFGQIINEVEMLRRLEIGVQRLPRVISNGTVGNHRGFVMTLVGTSLDKKLALSSGTLTLTETVSIAGDILEQLEQIHTLGIVHRDLKPENICMASAEVENTGGRWTLIDFGLACAKAVSPPIQNPTVSSTVAPRSGSSSVVGTARYASIAAHENKPLRPNDDLESLAFVLLFCCRSCPLPWQGLAARYREKGQRNEKVGEIKRSVTPQALCIGTLAAPLESFITECLDKKKEAPDYQLLRFLLSTVIKPPSVLTPARTALHTVTE